MRSRDQQEFWSRSDVARQSMPTTTPVHSAPRDPPNHACNFDRNSGGADSHGCRTFTNRGRVAAHLLRAGRNASVSGDGERRRPACVVSLPAHSAAPGRVVAFRLRRSKSNRSRKPFPLPLPSGECLSRPSSGEFRWRGERGPATGRAMATHPALAESRLRMCCVTNGACRCSP
jgi:hypothetical protein